MTPTTTCPRCNATYRVTDLHWCRREPQRAPEPAGAAFWCALGAMLLVLAVVCGWALCKAVR